MKIAIIDNYDSFVYNLVRYIRENESVQETTVMRNDEVDFALLEQCDGILLSPGPGIPSEAGSLFEVLETFAKKKSILGICLGHQALVEFYGGTLEHAPEIMHGKASSIQIDNAHFLFSTLDKEIQVGRYHSWQVNVSLPAELISVARFGNQVMGVCHKDYKNYGLQFHPESVLTPEGRKIINNWIASCKQH
ncbi:MAG: aminodeoxychorismate/anthranilate synthase component II [Brumimicrobium sp.]|nr:aminodeoxychorismate/anthranilate synthase component II [Brumimicrobium sp.]